jgi:hypothetical protein
MQDLLHHPILNLAGRVVRCRPLVRRIGITLGLAGSASAMEAGPAYAKAAAEPADFPAGPRMFEDPLLAADLPLVVVRRSHAPSPSPEIIEGASLNRAVLQALTPLVESNPASDGHVHIGPHQ